MNIREESFSHVVLYGSAYYREFCKLVSPLALSVMCGVTNVRGEGYPCPTPQSDDTRCIWSLISKYKGRELEIESKREKYGESSL